MDTEKTKWWYDKKIELLDGIRQAKTLGTTDPEILEIMEELLRVAKLSNSLTDYYQDFKED